MLERNENITNGLRLSVVDLPKLPERYSIHRKKSDTKLEMKKTEKAKEQQSSNQYVTMFLAELLGTGLLLFLGCMGCIKEVDSPPAVHHMSSLSFGLVVMLIIQTVGHISGAHLNPAVTIATVIFKMLTPKMGIVYIVAQFIGATLGFGLLKLVAPADYTGNNFCATVPHELTTPFQALAIETIITTVLILVCCAVWDKRNADKPDSTPLRFGFVIVCISMVAGPFTGASMNTARSFAPVLFSKIWDDQWIYLVGPNAGAFIGCALYKYLFAIEDDDDESEKEDQIRLEEVPHTNKS